ncbi:hypothetical protein M422DRAFT_181523 [Sphaerobolus stellatus SS14]|uniref:Uncharacterized protein n=1 Tax=Sphaerobolus stellatus (strain SS14) TaxID=990650 RepID=A0A0C9VCB1_SPHS4|nr:hypothetical protein M422DRAFT_181523 [Sphaerobolus stellatus SS14]
MGSFIRRRGNESITIIPVPLPEQAPKNSLNDYFYPDSKSQDLFAIMDTCLNECYDVPRAREIFQSTQDHPKLRHMLKIPMYNKFLLAYGTMASRFEQHRDAWLCEALTLFNRLESNLENVTPNAETYVVLAMLLCR